jgi:hypothetical protein
LSVKLAYQFNVVRDEPAGICTLPVSELLKSITELAAIEVPIVTAGI